MKGVWAVPVIVGIAVMMTLSVLPAMAEHFAGTIVSINRADNHGTIEQTVGDVTTLYQFRIPQDLSDSSYSPKVGDSVKFHVDPDNSRHATDVVFITPPPGGGI